MVREVCVVVLRLIGGAEPVAVQLCGHTRIHGPPGAMGRARGVHAEHDRVGAEDLRSRGCGVGRLGSARPAHRRRRCHGLDWQHPLRQLRVDGNARACACRRCRAPRPRWGRRAASTLTRRTARRIVRPVRAIGGPRGARGARSPAGQMLSQSVNRNSKRCRSSVMRPITVRPKALPKLIMRNQMPTRAVLPTAPLCSTEKKK